MRLQVERLARLLTLNAAVGNVEMYKEPTATDTPRTVRVNREAFGGSLTRVSIYEAVHNASWTIEEIMLYTEHNMNVDVRL